MPLPNDFVVVVVEAQTGVVATAGGGGVSAIRPGPGVAVDHQTGIVTVSLASGNQYQEIALGDQTGSIQLDLDGFLETVFTINLTGNAEILPPVNAVVGARFIFDLTGATHTWTDPAGTKWVNGPATFTPSSTRDVIVYWVREIEAAVVDGQLAIIPSLMLAWSLDGFA